MIMVHLFARRLSLPSPLAAVAKTPPVLVNGAASRPNPVEFAL